MGSRALVDLREIFAID